MWVLVHVTDSMRPADAVVTDASVRAGAEIVAAAEGIAAPVSEAGRRREPFLEGEPAATRHRRRKAHGLSGISRVWRRRAAIPA